MRLRLVYLLLPFAILLLAGCQSAYYGAMEQFGYHKREILTDRVEEARDSQEEAKKQFQSALDQFRSVVAFDGGNLEKQYDQLQRAYENSKTRAEAVTSRIDAVEDVGQALFREWRGELNQYTNPDLRRLSENRLRETEREYDQLVAAMRNAERRMAPVLAALKDQTLFLKHNLNARAIGSLKGELSVVEDNVNVLIADMEAAISQADAFIRQMKE